MAESLFSYKCCNPIDHSSMRKNLRDVLPWMIEKFPTISLGEKICDECRKQVGRSSIPKAASPFDEEAEKETLFLSDPDFCSPPLPQRQFKTVNQCLEAIGETPLAAHKLSQVKYPKQKMKKLPNHSKKLCLKK